MSQMDWTVIGETWRANSREIDTAPLQKILAAQRRRRMLVVTGELAIIIGLIALSAIVTRDGVELWEAVWLITLWAFTIIAAAFAWWNRRGTWRAQGESVEEYVRLMRLRAERQMDSIYFVWGLFAAEVVAVVAQLLWVGRMSLFAAVILAASGVPIVVWCAITKRTVTRELLQMRRYNQAAADDSTV